MASSTTTKPEAQAPPTAGSPMGNPWKQWAEPAIASPIITALVIALVSIGVVGFQSLKGDIRDTEARLTEEIRDIEARLTEETRDTEARLREEIQASEARLTEEISKQREDLRALSDKLDRVLESLLAGRS